MVAMTLQIAAAACAFAAGAATLQPRGVGSAIDVRALRPLDQTHEDTGPLRTSLLSQPVDLRQPLGFEQVYRLPGSGTDRLARISGGLAAVFPRSSYVRTAKGDFALVPPGTVFYIGAIPAEQAVARSMPAGSADMRSDTRAESGGDPERIEKIATHVADSSQTFPKPRVIERDSRPAIMTDEGYRAARVRELLKSASTGSQRSR
jgi:hypothetical protein